MFKLLLGFAATAISYVSGVCGIIQKIFSPSKEHKILKIQVLDMYCFMIDHHIRLNTFSKPKKMGTI